MPSIRISMNTPQNTPSAVKNARSLLLRSVAQTSCQVSQSSTQGLHRADIGGVPRWEKTRQGTAKHQHSAGQQRDRKIDVRLAQVWHVLQVARREFDQPDPGKQAR